ncbi:MAG: hypothetical protein VB013_08200 [Anaerolineaceae bacterium]|nr:hypothetical protein [Anaerolineaceae bacterium]
MQPDTLVPEPGSSQGYNRYAYANNNPINYTDPSGHCANTLSLLGNIISCTRAFFTTLNVYNNGVRNPFQLASAAFGLTDRISDIHEKIDSLNHDSDIVFSNDPSISSGERWRASKNVGLFAVGTAANIVGGVQVVRGISAFTRSGVGGSDYFVEGTKFNETFLKGDKLFRISGSDAQNIGNWAFRQNPGNQINAIQSGALPPGNSARFISTVNVNGLVDGEVSQVSSLFGQPGGAWQVKIPGANPLLEFGVPQRLPIGLMPFVPVFPLIDVSNSNQ